MTMVCLIMSTEIGGNTFPINNPNKIYITGDVLVMWQLD